MATFVIVHGAWSGAHAWRWIRALLRDDGHDVFAPSLVGILYRVTWRTPRSIWRRISAMSLARWSLRTFVT